MTIGILALQGDYSAHRVILETISSHRVLDVRTSGELHDCDGLIIPGGESTTMSRLCDRYDLWAPLQQKIESGMGAFGTCAGLIMLAKNIEGATKNFAQKTLRVLDVDVARNAYGAQLDSFECEVEWEIGDAVKSSGFQPPPMRAVFIRAPRITRIGAGVEVLARHEGEAVAVRQRKIMACAFHPEIAGESALHRVWIESLHSHLGGEREKEAI